MITTKHKANVISLYELVSITALFLYTFFYVILESSFIYLDGVLNNLLIARYVFFVVFFAISFSSLTTNKYFVVVFFPFCVISFFYKAFLIKEYFVILSFFLLIISLLTKKINKYSFIFYLLLAVSTIQSFLFDFDYWFLPYIIIVFALRKCSYKRICWSSILALFFSTLFIMCMSIIGFLPDEVQTRTIGKVNGINLLSGEYTRHTFGMLVHNQVPFNFFVILLLVLIVKNNRFTYLDFLLFCLTDIAVFVYFGSRMVFILSLLALFLWFISKKCKFSMPKELYSLLPFFYPVLFALSFIFSVLYKDNEKVWKVLNSVFNNRLIQANKGFQAYGITIWGFGNNSANYNSGLGFTVDNAYMYLYFQRGLLISLIITFFYFVISRNLVKHKYYYYVWLLTVFAFANVIDYYLVSYRSISFLCMFFCLLSDNNTSRRLI